MRAKQRALLSVVIVSLAGLAGGITVETAPFTVDLRDDAAPRCVVDATKIEYSASWAASSATAATKCVLVKSSHVGTERRVDTTLVDATEEGSVSLTPDVDGGRVYTVTMKAMNGTTEIGSVSREILFGYVTVAEDVARADTTTNKMQHVVDEGVSKAFLRCDTSWVNGAVSADLIQTRTPWTGKKTRGTPVQTTLANYVAPTDSAYEHPIRQNDGADYAFSLVFRDDKGDPIGGPYLAGYSIGCKFGFVLIWE